MQRLGFEPAASSRKSNALTTAPPSHQCSCFTKRRLHSFQTGSKNRLSAGESALRQTRRKSTETLTTDESSAVSLGSGTVARSDIADFTPKTTDSAIWLRRRCSAVYAGGPSLRSAELDVDATPEQPSASKGRHHKQLSRAMSYAGLTLYNQPTTTEYACSFNTECRAISPRYGNGSVGQWVRGHCCQ